MSKLNIFAVALAWASGLFSFKVDENMDDTEAFELMKSSAEKKIADLEAKIAASEKQGETVAAQATALETTNELLKTLSEKFDAAEKASAKAIAEAKAESEKSIKELSDKFAKQLAGGEQTEGTDSAFPIGEKTSNKKVVLEGWAKKNNIQKTTIA